jgi:hypothetical protein
MPAPKGNTISGLHIGRMINAQQKAQRVTHAVLARRIGRNQSIIKRYFGNSSLQTYLVWELSLALNHNFFADLAQQLNAATEGQLDKQESELEQLKAEYQSLTEERDYLRKAVDGLTRKI